EPREVDLLARHRQLPLQVHALLHELEAGERVGALEPFLDGGQPLLDRFRRALAAPLRSVGLERLQVSADGPSLFAALGQSGLVTGGHGGFGALLLGRHLHDCGLPSRRNSSIGLTVHFLAPHTTTVRPWVPKTLSIGRWASPTTRRPPSNGCSA